MFGSVVEVFTFFQMGGELQRVDIVPLGAAIDFSRFDVQHAKCFDANDKAKLLTAIESAFGAYGPFNAIVRRLLTSASTPSTTPTDGDGSQAAMEQLEVEQARSG